MASKTENLFTEIEQAQEELRESIEHSRVLVERSDALIRQVKDQALEAGAASAAAQTQSPPAALTSPR